MANVDNVKYCLEGIKVRLDDPTYKSIKVYLDVIEDEMVGEVTNGDSTFVWEDELRKLMQRENRTAFWIGKQTGLHYGCIKKWLKGLDNGGIYNVQDVLDCLGYRLAIVKK